jgi:hypothetical protein
VGTWGLTTGYGRHNRDFVSIFERRFLILEETNVFAVHIDVEEPPQFAVFITESAEDAWVAAF